jgi:hypothetical protein
MSTSDESSLAARAKHQINICCETQCERLVVMEYIAELEAKIEKFKKIYTHANADKLEGVYFICGEAGPKDDMGLPDSIFVCPAYGLDGMSIYKKVKDYSAPEW